MATSVKHPKHVAGYCKQKEICLPIKLGPLSEKKNSSNCCVVLCIVCFVSFYVLFVCKCVPLPPGVNPIAVNKYISYHITYHIISYIISYIIA